MPRTCDAAGADVLGLLRERGLLLTLVDGGIRVSSRSPITDEVRSLIRAHRTELVAALAATSGACVDAPNAEHKRELLAVLAGAGGTGRPEARGDALEPPACAAAAQPPQQLAGEIVADPRAGRVSLPTTALDSLLFEFAEERAGILEFDAGFDRAEAERRAAEETERFRRECFDRLRNARRIIDAPAARRDALLAQYEDEAIRRYGSEIGVLLGREMLAYVRYRLVLETISDLEGDN